MSAPHPVHSTAQPSHPENAVPATGAPTAQPAHDAPKKAPKQKKGDIVGGMAALELNPPPEYLASRVELFDQLKKEYEEMVASAYSIPRLATLQQLPAAGGSSWR